MKLRHISVIVLLAFGLVALHPGSCQVAVGAPIKSGSKPKPKPDKNPPKKVIKPPGKDKDPGKLPPGESGSASGAGTDKKPGDKIEPPPPAAAGDTKLNANKKLETPEAVEAKMRQRMDEAVDSVLSAKDFPDNRKLRSRIDEAIDSYVVRLKGKKPLKDTDPKGKPKVEQPESLEQRERSARSELNQELESLPLDGPRKDRLRKEINEAVEAHEAAMRRARESQEREEDLLGDLLKKKENK